MTLFVAVADLRGFAPAARRMRVSASAATRMIAALEEHLGARLLQRTTRSVTLTDAGARYLERARRILADVAEAEEAAQSERSVPKGRFVVNAPAVFGRLHVAPAMSAFLEKYPAVRGQLLLEDRVASLVEEGIDVAVRIGALHDSSYVARPVGATRRVLVASPRYLAGHKKIRSPEDLARHRAIQFTALAATEDWVFWSGERETRVRLDAYCATNSADVAIFRAESGGGVALALCYQVREAVKGGRLVILLPQYEPPPRPIQLVFPTTRLLSAKVRAFVELVTKTCDWGPLPK
jgi:DNA-binding transcriptional LysR family regulator